MRLCVHAFIGIHIIGCVQSQNEMSGISEEKRRAILGGKVILGMSPDEAHRAAGPFVFAVIGDRPKDFSPEDILARPQSLNEHLAIRMRFCNTTQYDSNDRIPFFVIFRKGKAVEILTLEEFEASEEYEQESEVIRAASKAVIIESISKYYSPQSLGSDPVNEIPLFIGLLGKWDTSEGAAVALGRIGKPATPALIEALSDADSRVRQYSMLALSYMGPVAAPSVPYLIRSFEKADNENLGYAAEALGRIGPPSAAAAVSVLIAGLKHREVYVRAPCAEALGRIGPEAVASIPALEAALRD